MDVKNIFILFAVALAGVVLSSCTETSNNGGAGVSLTQSPSLSSSPPTDGGGSNKMEAPEGVVYCGGGGIKRQIEYNLLTNSQDKWDARVTVNGETRKAMTAYTYYGNAQAPKGFVVALLGEDRSEFLVFKDGNRNYIEFGDYQYNQCN
jgi:hypothetical protein